MILVIVGCALIIARITERSTYTFRSYTVHVSPRVKISDYRYFPIRDEEQVRLQDIENGMIKASFTISSSREKPEIIEYDTNESVEIDGKTLTKLTKNNTGDAESFYIEALYGNLNDRYFILESQVSQTNKGYFPIEKLFKMTHFSDKSLKKSIITENFDPFINGQTKQYDFSDFSITIEDPMEFQSYSYDSQSKSFEFNTDRKQKFPVRIAIDVIQGPYTQDIDNSFIKGTFRGFPSYQSKTDKLANGGGEYETFPDTLIIELPTKYIKIYKIGSSDDFYEGNLSKKLYSLFDSLRFNTGK